MSRISQLIATADDIESEDVEIPIWGCTIRIKGMNGYGRSTYLARLIKAREEEDEQKISEIEAELIIACAYDPEDDSLCFVSSDVPMLLEHSGAVLGVLSQKALRLSGLDGEAETRLGKGSSASAVTDAQVVPAAETPSVDSTSTLPVN